MILKPLHYYLFVTSILFALTEAHAQNHSIEHHNYQHLKNRFKNFDSKSRITFRPLNYFQYFNTHPFDQSISYIAIGDISPHFYLFDKNLEEKTSIQNLQYDKFLHRFYVNLNPRIQIRLLNNEYFETARNPTAQPSVTLHWLWQPKAQARYQFNFYAGFTHHSNGQDGPTIAEEAIRYYNQFYFLMHVLENRKLNTYNGNFSTNIFPLGVKIIEERKKWNEKPTIFINEIVTSHLRFMDFRLEPHSKVMGIPGENLMFGHAPALDGYQSYFDLHLNFQHLRKGIFLKGHKAFDANDPNQEHEIDRLSLNLHLRTGNMEKLESSKLPRRIDLDLTYMRRLLRSTQTALFVRAGYYGADFYNIFLEDQLIIFQVGLAAGKFNALK